MGYEGSAHEVVVDLPVAAHLGEIEFLVFDETQGRRDELARGHVSVVEHAGHVLLEDAVAVGDDVLQGEVRFVALRGILVDEDVLVDIHLLVAHPDEVRRLLLQLVAGREMGRAADHFRHLREDGSFLVEPRVGDDAVALRLLDGLGDHFPVLLGDLDRPLVADGADLDHALGARPDVIQVLDAFLLHLRVDLIDDEVAVDLEEVHKVGRDHVDQRIQGFARRQVGAVAGQELPDRIAGLPFPGGLVHHDEDFAGLAADGREEFLGRFVAAGHEGQHQGGKEGHLFHIQLFT